MPGKIVKEYINSLSSADGNFLQLKLWKLKNKLCPKTSEPPMAQKDENETLVTHPELLKSLYLRTYMNRLCSREMKPELLDVFFLKEELWSSRMEELKRRKSLPWTIVEAMILNLLFYSYLMGSRINSSYQNSW